MNRLAVSTAAPSATRIAISPRPSTWSPTPVDRCRRRPRATWPPPRRWCGRRSCRTAAPPPARIAALRSVGAPAAVGPPLASACSASLSAPNSRLPQRLRLGDVLLLGRARRAEAGGLHLARVKVADLGADAVAGVLGQLGREHVADQQHADELAVRLGDGGQRHLGHPVVHRPDVLDGLAPQGLRDRRELGLQIVAPHGVGVQIARDHLAVGAQDGDDGGLAPLLLQAGVERLALGEGRLPPGGLVGPVEDRHDAGALGPLEGLHGRVGRAQPPDLGERALGARHVPLDLLDGAGPEALA